MGIDIDFSTYFGDAIKVADDGQVSGYLVRFSTPSDPDLAGEFFTADTDFGVNFDDQTAAKTALLYSHGFNKEVGKQRIGEGTLKMDDVGIWVEGQLKIREKYVKGVLKMAKNGKLGWSSGTAPHLVEYEDVGKARWIKSWPLGLDASLTPTPAEPRTHVVSLKSLLEETEGLEDEGVTFAEQIAQTIDTVKSCVTRIEEYAAMKAKDDRRVNPERRQDFSALKDALDQILLATAPKPDPEIEAMKFAWLREKNRRRRAR